MTILAALVLWTGATGPALAADGARQAERVTLQLKWRHKFQFAGYHAAQAKGFFRDEGLEVTIREGARTGRPWPQSSMVKPSTVLAIPTW